MIKNVYFKDGKAFHIGEWDDDNGSNPLPEESTIKECECVLGPDGGIYLQDDPRLQENK